MTKLSFWGGATLCEIPESMLLSTVIGSSVSNNSQTVSLSVTLLFTMFICLVIVILGFGSLVYISCKDL